MKEIIGKWSVVGVSKCMRCSIKRRLYMPDMYKILKVCAPCAAVCATSSLPAQDEGEEEDRDSIWLQTLLGDKSDT